MAAPPAHGEYQSFHFKEQRFQVVDSSKVAVQLPDGVGIAQIANELTKNGLNAAKASPSAINGWFMVPTLPGSDNAASIENAVRALAANPMVQFAAPVFVGEENLPYWPTQYLMVEFKGGVNDGSRQALLSKAGVRNVDYRWSIMPNAARVQLLTKNGFEALDASNALAVANETTFAECDSIITAKHTLIPNDTLFGDLWGIHNTGQAGGTVDADMDGPEAWEFTTGIPSVITVVMDIGVQSAHPDLNMFTPGNDLTGNGTAGEPGNSCDNHGTAVASCIAARINNGLGVTGIAPGTRVASARIGVSVVPCNGTWNGNLSWSADAINWGVAIGARVTNNSNAYGGTSAAVETAYLNSHNANNMVHFASAGNSGAGSLAYPASIPVVNSVAALDRTGNRAGFSQFGAGLDFSAPGASIDTCDRTGANGYVNGDYAVLDGTSFASPYAAGVAALIISRNPALTSSQVESIMQTTAVDLGPAGYDTGYGYGFVNAYNGVITAAAPPSNDQCANATFMTVGTYTGNNANASLDAGSSNSCVFNVGKDVYYRFTPTCSTTYRFDTCGSTFDTGLSIHTGCPATSANQVACNDDQGGATCPSLSTTSRIDVALTAGTPYLIRLGSYNNNAGGAYTLALSQLSGQPANDVCGSATPMALNTPYTGDTSCATPDGANSCFSTVSNDVWYSLTAGCTGTYNFSLCGSSYDTSLSVHTGCPGNSGNQIACNDDFCGLQSQFSVNLTAGNTYRIRVGGFGTNAGPYSLTATYVQGPQANDQCSAATPIAVGGTASGSTVCASVDGAGTCASSAGSPDVWYTFTSDCSGWYVADTQTSGYDTALSVHTGCPGNTSNEVACNDDFFGFQSRVVWYQPAGTTYRIRVSGYNGASGSYVLHMGNLPNDTCGNYVFLPGNGSFGYSNRGATTDGTAAGICVDVGGNQNINQDVWFLYQASCNGTVTANTCDSIGYDSKMAAYNYQACPPSNPLACNDDMGGSCPFSGVRSQVTFPVTQGAYYFIRIGGYSTATGCGVLNVTCQAAGCYGACVADFDDGSMSGTPDGGVTIDDLLYYLRIFELGDLCADVDDGSMTNTLDGGVTIDDLLYFLTRFEAGC